MTQCTIYLSYAPRRTLPVTPVLARQLLTDGLVVETMTLGTFNLGVTPDVLWQYLKRVSE